MRLGEGTFWKKKSNWLERETSFNVDRIQTPALFSSIMSGADYPMTALATIGAFQLNHKAYDYVFLPDASHPLRRPRQRFEMMNLVVEWLDFWLKGDEPADKDRAARWRTIKTAWEATQAQVPH